MTDRAVMNLLGILLLLVSACGGGGSTRPDPPPAPQRTDLLFGYYGGKESTPLEVKDHVNLYWAPGWDGLQGTIAELRNAVDIPNIVLAVPAYLANAEAEVRAYLTGIKGAGLLKRIIALYPIDEPDIEENGNLSDEVVTATNAMLRRVMLDYPELKATKLWVIYGCSTGRTPGIKSYDAAGCDAYERGCDAEQGGLEPWQRRLRIPGGADPWREDPACQINKANADPQTIAVIAFTHIDYGPAGIRSNGMLPTYRAAGFKLTKETP